MVSMKLNSQVLQPLGQVPRNETEYGLVVWIENDKKQSLAYSEACPVNEKSSLLQQASALATFAR